MDAPRLPHDVLLNVASFADRTSILALLTTTPNLHSDCGKYVLQDPVVLGGDLDIVSFIDFMRPHEYKRWRHLHTLRLRGEPISPRIAEALAGVIPRASHLATLEFEHAETTLGSHPDLPLAFAALRTIKNIIINHGYQHTCRMFEAMRWPLESAELMHSDHEFTHDLHLIHPAALLRNSYATLKTLEGQLWSDFDDVLDTYPVYPQLESLCVGGIWCPSVAHWAISYPNLKRLTIDTIDGHIINEAIEDHFGAYSAIRSRKLEEHMEQERWIRLEEFVGNNALDLYLLGLPCHIRAVIFTALSTASLPFFAPAMETARPMDLTLSITSELFSQPIPTYLESLGLADVKRLGIAVTVQVCGTDADTGEIDVDCFLGHVLGMLQRASTQEFAIFLEVNTRGEGDTDVVEDQDKQPETMHPSALPRASPIEIWIHNADLDALVRRFQDAVPSLHWAKFSVRASSTSCWKEAESSRKRGTDGRWKDAPLLEG